MIRSFIIRQHNLWSAVSGPSWLSLCKSGVAWTLEILMTRRSQSALLWLCGLRLAGDKIWHGRLCCVRSRALTNDTRDPQSEAWSRLIDTTCHVSQCDTCHVSVISSYIYHPAVSSDARPVPGPSLAQHLLIMAGDELFSRATFCRDLRDHAWHPVIN